MKFRFRFPRISLWAACFAVFGGAAIGLFGKYLGLGWIEQAVLVFIYGFGLGMMDKQRGDKR